MPTTRFVISSYDIASTDSALNTDDTQTVTRFTDPTKIPKSKHFKKSGRTGFKMASTTPLTMGAGTILGSASNASRVKYDTFTIEFPYYFYKSVNTEGKEVEIEKVHLFQKVSSLTADHEDKYQTTKTVITTPLDGTPPTTSKITEIVSNTVFGDDKYKKIDATIHSSLARFNTNFDRFVCTSNTDYYQSPRVFPLPDNTRDFDLWCYTLNGDIIDVDPEKTIIVCEFKLTY